MQVVGERKPAMPKQSQSLQLLMAQLVNGLHAKNRAGPGPVEIMPSYSCMRRAWLQYNSQGGACRSAGRYIAV
jgi:hypothetical protein